jgi:hypothetical protein
LTPKDFALLEYLMRDAGRDVTRAQIIDHVWNLSFDTMTNVVDVYINYSSAQVDKRKVPGSSPWPSKSHFSRWAFSIRRIPSHTERMFFAGVQIIENVQRLQEMGRLVNSPQGKSAQFQ